MFLSYWAVSRAKKKLTENDVRNARAGEQGSILPTAGAAD
jgi:hypothetical protein